MNDHMDNENDSTPGSSIGMGILAFISAMVASWFALAAFTRSAGLALVFSIFIALFAFDYGRRSIIATLSIFMASMLLVIAQAFFHLLN